MDYSPRTMRQQYGSDVSLRARQSLWGDQVGPSLYARVLDLAGLTGDESIVDVGCGNGRYLAELAGRGHRGRRLGVDRSPGMAAIASAHAPTVVGDAGALPVVTGRADVVLCAHMLYHVPDIAGAVAELRRVTRPGGLVLVVTNDTGHTAEAVRIMDEAVRRTTGAGPGRTALGRFDGAHATAVLTARFDTVTAHPLGSRTTLTDPAVVAGYLRSLPAPAVGLADDDPAWPAVLDHAERLVDDHFATHPTFTLTSTVVAFLAR